ncbi:MAG: MarR family winged helix-turn-helix transcriptional regulator [Bacilli bacterium]
MEYEKNICMYLKKISNQMKRVIDKRLGHNITNIQLFILGYIQKNEKHKKIYQKDIENILNIRRSTTTEILNVMEKNDLLKRIESIDDKRKKIIILSNKGIEYVKEFEKTISKVEKEILKDISKEEQENFFYVLEKIKKNLDNL